MILVAVILYDIIAVTVTLAALLCVYFGSMTGMLICSVVSGVALVALGLVLATHE